MSGICGLFNLDHAPVEQADLRAMTTMLERCGPDGSGQWHDGPFGLGHSLLATTPEAIIERQPFKHAETGCVITADVRLDNRNELLGKLGNPGQYDSIGDAELILMAYLAWGEKCVDHLLGDFAFAICDPRHQTLFCARDHFGMRPFCYYHSQGHASGQHFVFASDPRAILVLPQIPYRINEGRVADFLVPQLEWIDYTSTFFEDVYRLPPGHCLVVTRAGLSIVEYWKPQPGPDPGPISDEDYVQGFLEVFTDSVKARLRAPPDSLGSMLSGGMDSGSVVAVAKEILSSRGDGPLSTYSAVRCRDTDDTNCAESQAIYAAAMMSSISPGLIHPGALESDFEQMISGLAEPFDGEFMILKAVYRAAQSDGRRIVLDGAAGDTVLTEGSYIVRLIRQGHFKLAIKEIQAENGFWGWGSTTESLLRYSRGAIVPEAVKKALQNLRNRRKIREYVGESLISRDFASSVRIEDRFERMRETFARSWTPDYAVECCNVIRPSVTAGRERYGRIAAATGIEARDPFLDKRVVDYCSRLPGRFRLKDGWPKMILRDMMADKLPSEVLWCRGKPHLGWFFNEIVTKRALHRGELNVAGLRTAFADYVDPAALDKAWRAFHENGYEEQIHSAFLLSVWLQESAQRPVVPSC